MKKLIAFFITALLLTLLCVSVSAADFNIEKIVYFRDEYCVLTDTGYLFHTNTLDNSAKTLMERDVVDIVADDNSKIMLVLKKDGSLTRYTSIIDDPEKVDKTAKFIITKPKKVFNFWSHYLLYLDTENTLRLADLQNTLSLTAIDFVVASNTKMVADGSAYSGSYINNNNELYFYKVSGTRVNEKFVMTDVIDAYIIPETTTTYATKSNGDLYRCIEEGGTVTCEKIVSKTVASCENVALDENDVLWGIQPQRIAKITEYVKKVIYKDHPDDFNKRCYLSVDIFGDLYEIGLSNTTPRKVDLDNYKVETVLGAGEEKLFFKTKDGKLVYRYLDDFTEKYFYSEIPESGNVKLVYLESFRREPYKSLIVVLENGNVWYSTDGKFNKSPFSSKSTALYLDGELIKLTNPIKLISDRTMYPFREFLNIIGATVQWDGETRTAIGEMPDLKVEFPVGRKEYYINGRRNVMDVETFVDPVLGKTYIPIRYMAESLGFTVSWRGGEFENVIDIYS